MFCWEFDELKVEVLSSSERLIPIFGGCEIINKVPYGEEEKRRRPTKVEEKEDAYVRGNDERGRRLRKGRTTGRCGAVWTVG